MLSPSDSALNWYTAELASALSTIIPVQVIAPGDAGQRWHDGTVEVVAAYERGSRSAAIQIAKAALQSRAKVISVQHELFAFGGKATALSLPLALQFLRLNGKRVVTTIHGVVPLEDITPAFIRKNGSRLPMPIARLGWRTLLRAVCAASDAIVVHDERHRELLRSDYGVRSKIEVVPLGVPTAPPITKAERQQARASLAIDSDAEVLMFFGYFAGYKGLERLFDAAPRLLKERRNLHLVLAGDVPARLASSSSLGRQASLLAEAHDRIHHLGFVPESRVREVFAASDALILPYTAGISASGPLALAVAHGIPVIISSLLADRSHNAAFVFDPDINGICDAVRGFFTDLDVRLDALHFVEEIRKEREWTNTAKRLAAVYSF